MQNILLLHGALGSADTLDPLKQALEGKYKVYTLDFSGHGGKAIPGEPYSMHLFANDISALLEKEEIAQTHIFGYSMGGYAALYFALQHPERVNSIFTLATKFAWSPETAAKETKMLDPAKVEEKVPAFAQALAQRHAPQDWKTVMRKTADMMLHLGKAPGLTTDNLPMLEVPVRVSVGDRDNMVSVEETLWAYKHLPNASLMVLPATRHPLETIPTAKLAAELDDFISTVTPQTAALHQT